MKFLLIALIEIILFVTFWIMQMYKGNAWKKNLVSILKGIIERAFLTFALLINIPLVIIFFSALKLGTRLDHESQTKAKVSNDQFLIGNILSLTGALIYMILLEDLF